MPAYAQIVNFMALVNGVNDHFERVKTSSLRPLIDILNDINGNAGQVDQALAAVPVAKTQKYAAALYYLVGNYPGVNPNQLNLGPLGKTDAARFTQTPVPANYDPTPPAGHRVVAQSAFLNQTVEQFLIANQGTGIILIHVSNLVPEMQDVFNNLRVVDHMNSVLQVGLDNGADLCVLHQVNPPVCAELQVAANGYAGARRTDCHVHPQHMGSRNPNFAAFATTHANLVVMGFDAAVCVRANMFGAQEALPAGGWVPPLISQANLISSRAVLATGGTIGPFHHQGEFGVLFNT